MIRILSMMLALALILIQRDELGEALVHGYLGLNLAALVLLVHLAIEVHDWARRAGA